MAVYGHVRLIHSITALVNINISAAISTLLRPVKGFVYSIT
jgi:hypothetical protein